MKIIVVYKSKTGFTRKYAEMIAEELSSDICRASKITFEELKNYDVIIFGGGLYAGGINGINLVKKNLSELKEKKIIVFATGATPGREDEIKYMKATNFTDCELETINFFYLRGGFDYSKLSMVDKILMSMLKLKLKSKKELSIDEKGMLEAYSTPVDFTRRKNIEELILFIKSELKLDLRA